MQGASGYARQWADARKTYAAREAFGVKERARENEMRSLFAQGKTADPAVADPRANLLPVHDPALTDAFKFAARFPEDGKVPVVFPRKTPPDTSQSAIVGYDEFIRNWRTFTEGSLQYLDFTNVFVAGGAVQACLMPIPSHVAGTVGARRDYLRNAFPAADIDLFIYGLGEEDAKKKMEDIYQAVCSTVPFETVAIRSSHAVTIVSQFPFRHIQLILRLYTSPSEILCGFDVDSCAVGFDGSQVWCAPRAHLAMVTARNTIDMSRRSPSYEVRLAKYAARGFEVAVEGLNRKRIDPQLFERPFDKVQGLARLLLLEAFPTPADRMTYKEKQRQWRLRPQHERAGEYNRRRRGRDLTGNNVDSNDYSSVFLPYGEGWTARKIVKKAMGKDYVLNNPYTRKLLRSTTHHQHPCFWGDMAEVLTDCCKLCPPFPADRDPKEDDLFVHGPLNFLTDDPGRQQVGSFNPITEGDWTAGAYLTAESEGLFAAIAARDADTVRAILGGGKVDVDARDPVGRTPLHLAVVCGAVEVVGVLVEAGAKIAVAVPDGRGVLHLCAEYWQVEAAKIVLAKNKQNIDAKKAREDATALAAKPKPAGGDEHGEDSDSEEHDGGKTEEEYDMVSKGDESFVDVAQELSPAKRGEFNPFKKAADDPMEEEPPADDIIDLEFVDWDLKMTALHVAIFHGNLDMVKLLLEAGASKTKMMSVEVQVNSWSKSKCIVSPIVMAMACPNREAGKKVLQFLLDENFPVNQIDHDYATPLTIAVREGLLDLAKFLLEEHPRTKLAVNFLGFRDNAFYSPLRLAVENKDLDMVKLLRQFGAKVVIDETDCKRASAVMNKDPSRGRYRYYANDPAQAAKQTIQPLQAAVDTTNAAVISYLLENGADPNAPMATRWGGQQTETLLDTVRTKLKDTQKTLAVYKGEVASEKELGDDEFFLRSSKPGTWTNWCLNFKLDTEDRWRNERRPHITPNSPDDEEMEKLLAEEVEQTGVSQPRGNATAEEIKAWNIAIVAKRVERLKACEDALLKFGAKTAAELNPTNETGEAATPGRVVMSMARQQEQPKVERVDPMRTAYQYYGGEPANIKSFRWTIAQAGEEADRYHALFEAIFNGDEKRIRELTVDAPPGKEALVASRTSAGQLSTFAVAIFFGRIEALKALLQAASHQYVALEKEENKKEVGKIAKISNRAPAIHSDDEGSDEDEEDDLGGFDAATGKDPDDKGEGLSTEDHEPKERLVSRLRSVDLLLDSSFAIQNHHIFSEVLTEEERALMSNSLTSSINSFELAAIRGSKEIMQVLVEELQSFDAQRIVGTLGSIGNAEHYEIKYNLCSEISNGFQQIGNTLRTGPTYWAIVTGNLPVLRLLIENGLGGLHHEVLLTRNQREKLTEKRATEEAKQATADPTSYSTTTYVRLKSAWADKKKHRAATTQEEGTGEEEQAPGEDDFFNTWSETKASLVHLAILHHRGEVLDYLLSDDLQRSIDAFVEAYPEDPRSVQFRIAPKDRELFVNVLVRGLTHPKHGDLTVGHYAVFGKNAAGLKKYLEWMGKAFGAKKAVDYLNTKNREGLTPLHFAAAHGYESLLEPLVRLGASCTETDYAREWTPVHFASYEGRVKSVAKFITLIEGPTMSRIAAQPSRLYKHTPLMLASYRGHHRVVELLTQFLGTHAAADFMFRTALDLAVRGSYTDSVKVLLAMDDAEDALAKEDVAGLAPAGAAAQLLRMKLREGSLAELLPKKKQKKQEQPPALWPHEDEDEHVGSPQQDPVGVYAVLMEKLEQDMAGPKQTAPLEAVQSAVQTLIPEPAEAFPAPLSARESFFKRARANFSENGDRHNGGRSGNVLGSIRLGPK